MDKEEIKIKETKEQLKGVMVRYKIIKDELFELETELLYLGVDQYAIDNIKRQNA